MTIILIIILGLVFGSFVTAFTDRLHDGRNWVSGRSECDNCQHELTPADLVPVLSWVLRRGRCSHCNKAISWTYPVTELAMAALFAISYLYWPYSFTGLDMWRFGLWLATVVGLVSMSVYDLRWMIIPNKIIYPILGAWLAFTAFEAAFFGGGTELIRSSVLGILACGGVFYLLFQISAGRWIGGGDVKLGFLLGILAGGPLESLFLIMFASILGLMAALPFIVAKKIATKSHIPFGPMLVLAGYLVFLFGEQLIGWYMSDVLLVV